jgi:putative resolvase
MTSYTTGQFAALLGKHPRTVQRWDSAGLLVADRSPKGRRMYTDRHVALARGIDEEDTSIQTRAVIAYSRVSSQAQRPDLRNQRAVLETFCAARGLGDVEFVEEIGGGLNFHRPRFLQIIDRITKGEVGCLVIAHRDRLARFGYELVEHLAKLGKCEILVLNHETHSPEQEMVEDLMTVVHGFSSRLYGLRSYRKALGDALAQDRAGGTPA